MVEVQAGQRAGDGGVPVCHDDALGDTGIGAGDGVDADEGIVAAVAGTGATRLQTLHFGLLPQSIPQVLAFTIYRLEMNFRDATVLGLVGAGGIGYYIQLYVRGFQYEKVGVLLVVIIAVVTLLDQLTFWTRRWLD